MTVDRPTKFPARAHASKLVSELVKLMPEAERNGNHAIFVQGHPTSCRDDTDRELPFHQEANFNFLTGAYDVHTASVLVTFNGSDIQHTLFVPPADPLETMWSIPPPTLEDAAVRFDAGAIRSTTELEAQLAQLGDATIHTLPVTHEFPPLPSSVLDAFKKQKHSTEHLRRAFHLTRLTKTAEELELMRKANGITSGAHEVLMRELGRYAAKRAKATVTATKERTGFEGMTQWEVESEQDAEALFVATCRRMGAEMAYLPIVASGSHASTLHYVCNDRLFPSTASPRAPGDTSFTPRRLARGCCGDVPEHDHATSTKSLHTSAFEPQVLLIDAGCEVEGYASDVTRTIPVGNGGKFTPKAAHIYDIVLRMMKEAEERTRVGVHWDDIHLHTHKVLIDEFIKLGIFKGTAEEMLQSGLSAAFYPHGLGHSIGLDVHDSLQYLREVKLDVPASSAAVPAKLFTYLRIRQPLQAGMVLTIEPGCYFPPQLLDMHGVWESPLVDHEVLKTYLPVGGVRLEDSVVVRDNGEPCENITPVGRERAWVEARASGLE
ncbi:uncharacterized protein CcaverHIS019_0100300 [Cutaneotrichosporon cavernicola]|uniref:Aminopeptidase P N-terminal domain-containing protein n=1 Tax=Cutaneotrichosporon cavernicola TaxID=279322 RepID=A0AA48I0S5_9TREE|nr:uncharacterized protein CcaverHIS019_0100300 [Cutaneotrichosporon cavernicola]BEI87312.1 hypothetical protein CcaverHIS019_0100300 [Cutaneotrichosporon cavernicola]BEI95082.1 hypothetical protein CcaverHIS631_0100310 [Cutaneotrichosporon cavernicola]BEJ02856.1 hypothetical protein CcaverHIS641_0100310 [Cutaneotrichosporon cavernicola]